MLVPGRNHTALYNLDGSFHCHRCSEQLNRNSAQFMPPCSESVLGTEHTSCLDAGLLILTSLEPQAKFCKWALLLDLRAMHTSCFGRGAPAAILHPIKKFAPSASLRITWPVLKRMGYKPDRLEFNRLFSQYSLSIICFHLARGHPNIDCEMRLSSSYYPCSCCLDWSSQRSDSMEEGSHPVGLSCRLAPNIGLDRPWCPVEGSMVSLAQPGYIFLSFYSLGTRLALREED